MENKIKLEKTNKTHLIGNGNSAKYFVDDGCMSIVAFNIPQHGHRFTLLSIIDSQPVVAMKNTGWRTNCPILCSEKTYKTAQAHNVTGTWCPIYGEQYRSNSAHWAAREMLRVTVNEIHLYGMDSFWSDDLTSQMDSIVPRKQRPDLTKNWYPYWQEIFQQGNHLTWYIHTPLNVKIRVSAPNVKQITHEPRHSTDILAAKA